MALFDSPREARRRSKLRFLGIALAAATLLAAAPAMAGGMGGGGGHYHGGGGFHGGFHGGYHGGFHYGHFGYGHFGHFPHHGRYDHYGHFGHHGFYHHGFYHHGFHHHGFHHHGFYHHGFHHRFHRYGYGYGYGYGGYGYGGGCCYGGYGMSYPVIGYGSAYPYVYAEAPIYVAPPPVEVPAPQPVVMAPPPAPEAAPPEPEAFAVYFDFDRYDLTPEGRQVVDAAIAAAEAGGTAEIDLTGNTDLAGTAAYNWVLSKKRAETVRWYMVKHGIPDEEISVRWLGKSNPAVPTADGVRDPRNRRVEIVISPEGAPGPMSMAPGYDGEPDVAQADDEAPTEPVGPPTRLLPERY